jgi:hypothetical protein
VVSLPLSEWSYKEDAATRHIGPVAQDFYGTFKLGIDDKHISPIDEGGIAFAAIQALNEKLVEKDKKVQQLEERLRRLESLLEKENLPGK